MEPLPKRRCFCGRRFSRYSDFVDHQPHCPGDMTLTNRVSEYPSSPGIRVNRRSTDDSISSPYHGHSYTDISPNEPDNDSDDHHPHHQQNRTTKTESNRVSFGSNNSGAQVGINHGPITYNNSSENYANEYHQSSGGQIFNGDITAGRDIHIGTIDLQ